VARFARDESAGPSGAAGAVAFASRRDDAVAGLCGVWMVVGLFSDGWAHRNQKPETFFSPWHGLLYSGFVASAVWMLRVWRRGQAEGRRGLDAFPVGYATRVAGVAVFGVGGLLDFAWHSTFGIERSTEALLSPPHLVLLAGGLLMATGPIVSTLAREHPDRPTWASSGAIVGALTFMVSVIGFFLMYVSPYDHGRYDKVTMSDIVDSWLRDENWTAGIAAILLWTFMTTTALRWLISSRHVPRGGLFVVLVVPPVLQSALSSFDTLGRVLGAAVAGVVAEATFPLVRRLGSHVVVAVWIAALTLITWFGMFAAIALGDGVGWSAELWSGSGVLAALLAVVVVIAGGDPFRDEPSRAV
jgi:hypothetical protein